MAKYTITHTCGHQETVQLYGAHSDREWRINKMEASPCEDCLRQAANEKAEKEAREAGLPMLEGSAKQIAWATTIRQGIYNKRAEFIKLIDWMEQYPGEASQKGSVMAKMAELDRAYFGEAMTNEISALYWIDNRAKDIEAEATKLGIPYYRLINMMNKQ